MSQTCLRLGIDPDIAYYADNTTHAHTPHVVSNEGIVIAQTAEGLQNNAEPGLL